MKYNINTTCRSLLLSAMTISLALGMNSCKKEEPLDVDYSGRKVLSGNRSETDKWLDENILKPYNVAAIWRYTDIETHYGYDIVPPMEENVVPFMKMLDYVFMQSYIEVYEGSKAYKDPADFIRTYIPKQILLLGEYEYEGEGVRKLGQAEGGRKILLFGINHWQNKDDLSEFFHTMFHEFSHILHQNKLYSDKFQEITKDKYTGQWFNPKDDSAKRFRISREEGFVSDYARKNKDEDFVETLTYYLVLSPEGWQQLLADIDGREKAAEAAEKAENEHKTKDEIDQIRNATMVSVTNAARDAIVRKQAIVASYLAEKWSIDIDQLRDIVQRRLQVAYGTIHTRALVNGSVTLHPTALDQQILSQGLAAAFPADQLSTFSCDGCRRDFKLEEK